MDVEQTVLEEELSKAICKEQFENEEEEPEVKNEKLHQEEPSEMVLEKMDSLSEPTHVDPVVISVNETMNKKQKYVSQFELVVHGRGLLLCETYYEQKCIWMVNKGCFKMYIPIRQMHARSNEWYVYPAARMFVGKHALCMNLELNPGSLFAQRHNMGRKLFTYKIPKTTTKGSCITCRHAAGILVHK